MRRVTCNYRSTLTCVVLCFQVEITKLECLRKLFANENLLTFEGIPAGIGKLSNLQQFQAAANQLTTIPEGIARCGKLKYLNLNSNCLLTLPASIHYISDQCEINVEYCPDLVMPPKPEKPVPEENFYNVDFSLEHQCQLAGQKAPETVQKEKSK